MFGKSSSANKTATYAAHYWERVWFDLATHNWRSLSLVASQPGTHTLQAANALRDAALLYKDGTVLVIDGSRATPADLQTLQDVMADGLWAGERVIIALGDPLEHATSIPLARSTDASVLCVVLTVPLLEHTRSVVRAVGDSRFVGSVTFEP
ncbi:MAG: hypothetical protein H7Z40_18545 [Phycisphaerae bacterium]|nr:hypothetical protein [Gemmatimonadaceae bacterium]